MLLWHNGGAPSQHQPPPPPSQDLSAVPGGSEPPGMARGGGCGCQPCRPVQGLISGTGCHSGCSQPWGHPWGCRDPPGHPQACGFTAWCCGDGGEAARCHRSPRAPTPQGQGCKRGKAQEAACGQGGGSACHCPCLSPFPVPIPESTAAPQPL